MIEQSMLPDLLEETEGAHRNGGAASSSSSGSETDEETLTAKKKLERAKLRRKQEIRERHRQDYQEKLALREQERYVVHSSTGLVPTR